MDKITSEIWIGSSIDAHNALALHHSGIRSVLCLDGCLRGTDAKVLGVDRIEVVELIDGRGNRPEVFLRAVEMLKQLSRKNGSSGKFESDLTCS